MRYEIVVQGGQRNDERMAESLSRGIAKEPATNYCTGTIAVSAGQVTWSGHLTLRNLRANLSLDTHTHREDAILGSIPLYSLC